MHQPEPRAPQSRVRPQHESFLATTTTTASTVGVSHILGLGVCTVVGVTGGHAAWDAKKWCR